MDMNKSPAFQLYPGDWLSSMTVTMMTPAQEGAYFRLLCYDWSNDGIPDDDQILSSLSRLGEGWFNGGSTAIKKCFEPHPEKYGFLTNGRLEKEREKQKIWREKSSIGGKKSAESRRNKSKSQSDESLKGGSTNNDEMVEPKANISSSSSSSSSNSITNRNTIDTCTQQGWDADAGWSGIDSDFRDRMAKAYPNVVLDRELDAMHEWLLSNPRKANKKNWRAFITNWLNKVQRNAKSGKFFEPDQRMQIIGKIVGRTEDDLWSAEEVADFNAIPQITRGQVDLLTAYYNAPLPKAEDFRCKSLGSLIKNWTREIDKARAWFVEQKGVEA